MSYTIQRINPINILSIEPLSKWKILRSSALKDLSENKDYRTSWLKKLVRLEQFDLIKSYKDPYTGSKYVYLQSEGIKLFKDEFNCSLVNEKILAHESKLSELMYEIHKLDCVKDIRLDDEMVAKSEYFKSKVQVPDADMLLKRNDEYFNIAIELELTQKSKTRILSRFEHYHSGDYYNNVIYVFSIERLRDKYCDLYNELCKANDWDRKVMFMSDKYLIEKKMDLSRLSGSYEDRNMSFLEILRATGLNERATG